MKSILAALVLVVLLSPACRVISVDKPGDRSKEVMDAYLDKARPSDEHQKLAKMAGRWDVVSKFWMAEGEDPMIFKGTAINRMILEGRFLQSELLLSGAGMKADSLTLAGFDRRVQRFTVVSFDTLGTYYVTADGSREQKPESIVMSGETADPLQGGTQKYDWVYRFEGKDRFLAEIHFQTPEGSKMVVQTIHTRSK